MCTHTDAWERFEGATLFSGVDSLQVSGDSAFAWNGGRASIHRVSAMAAVDGYGIELLGTRAHELLGLSTVTRPRAGTFRVVRWRNGHAVHGDVYTALMGLSNDSADVLMSDSGRVDLRTTESGFDGGYVVYVSSDSVLHSGKARHYVVRGTFHLRKPRPLPLAS